MSAKPGTPSIESCGVVGRSVLNRRPNLATLAAVHETAKSTAFERAAGTEQLLVCRPRVPALRSSANCCHLDGRLESHQLHGSLCLRVPHEGLPDKPAAIVLRHHHADSGVDANHVRVDPAR
jgi:hypothetical protein